MFGDSFASTFNRTLWAFYPHFVLYPGYVYTYAYGQLLALSAYSRYRKIGEPFADDLLGMLAAGSTRSPQDLAGMIGIDLTDPDFWNAGLALVDEQVRAAERAASDLLGD